MVFAEVIEIHKFKNIGLTRCSATLPMYFITQNKVDHILIYSQLLLLEIKIMNGNKCEQGVF